MKAQNEEVYVLEGLQDELQGKQSSVNRVSHRPTYPLIRVVKELGFQIVAIGRAPFAVPDSVRTDHCYFVGAAIVAAVGDGDAATPFGGLVNLTVTSDKLLGILVPDQQASSMLGQGKIPLNQAFLGFASSRSELKVSSSGSQGLFKKRPSSVSIEGPYWDCHLSIEVSRMHVREFGEPRIQGGQQGELLAALGGS